MTAPRPLLPFDIPVSTCLACGKQAFPSRRIARRAARILYPGRRMRLHSCAGRWHHTSQGPWRTAAWKDYYSERTVA
jgi:hypothetical protein